MNTCIFTTELIKSAVFIADTMSSHVEWRSLAEFGGTPGVEETGPGCGAGLTRVEEEFLLLDRG